MPKSIKQLIRRDIETIGAEWIDRQPVLLGDYTATVQTGTPGVFYARQYNGKVIEVHNTANVPPTFDLHVIVGRKKSLPTTWQIIEVRETYLSPAGSGEIGYHHTQHEFPNGDTVWVDRKQITALTVLVQDAAGFIVTVFGATVRTSNGIAKISSQNVDLSSYVPTVGALFVSIETDDDGVVTTNAGDLFGSRETGTAADIPVPAAGKYMLAFVLLYENQTELTDDEIIVPMPLSTNPDNFSEAEHTHDDRYPIDLERYLAIYNYYIGSGTPGYKLGLATSHNGREWTIRDEAAIDLGASGQWDDDTVQFPKLLQVNGILYCYYAGKPGAGWTAFKIGLAQSFDGGLTWTRHASNPLINNNIGWENSVVFSPVVLYDREETDSAKRWKMWYAGSSFGQGIGYAWSADGISWTKSSANPVMTPGSGWEDTYIGPKAVIRRGSEFILFYAGRTGAAWSNGLATFTDPEGTYTRGANNPILSGDGITTTLTANLTLGSTTATVSDATVFPIGCPVWIGGSTRFLTRVIKRNSSTSLELADAAPVQINSGQIFRSIAYNSIDISGVRYDDGYKFTIVPHQPDGLTETGVHELTLLAYANDDLEAAYIDYSAGLQIPVTVAESQGTHVSRENFSLLDTYEEELRHKPSGAAAALFDDSEGDPEDITTGSAADGTSDFASRRDHVHHSDGFGQYRQFVYEVSAGDFTFVIDEDGNPVMALEDLE